MAIFVPLGIIFSWLVIPTAAPVKIIKQINTDLLPVVRFASDRSDYCVNIRTNKENTLWQLEWKNKHPLQVPSAVIYKTTHNNTNISNALLIGRIETRGDYVFALPADSTANRQLQFVLYDFIHQKVIDSFNF